MPDEYSDEDQFKKGGEDEAVCGWGGGWGGGGWGQTRKPHCPVLRRSGSDKVLKSCGHLNMEASSSSCGWMVATVSEGVGGRGGLWKDLAQDCGDSEEIEASEVIELGQSRV